MTPSHLRSLLVCALLLTACPGGTSTSPGCASTADCRGADECIGVDDGPVCGIGPQEECVDDGTCGEDQVCHAIDDGCSWDLVGSTCDSPCQPGDCSTGFTCEAGSCRATSCADDPTVCPAHQGCDPTTIDGSAPVYDRGHGCVNVTCSGDGECGDLFCVNGFCQTAPGTCGEPLLVP